MARLSHLDTLRLDLNAAELGVPVERLMARAGKALAREVLHALPDGGAAWFLCGKGNNGGDGFAAASLLLSRGHPVRVMLAVPKEDVRHPARAFLDALPAEHVHLWEGPPAKPPQGTVLVDCLLGTGTRGPPRPPYDAMLKWLAARKKEGHQVVACDIASGWGSKPCVVPHTTVTFHAAKTGMTRQNSGRIVIEDIGIPPEAGTRIGLGDLAVAFGPVRREGHKGDNGRVLVVGGGPYAGAPWYSAMAAARAGADLVYLLTPANTAHTVAAWGPTPIVLASEPGDMCTDASLDAFDKIVTKADAVVFGPGLGSNEATLGFAKAALRRIAKQGIPVVIDADGLDAVEPTFLRKHGKKTVLTPHAEEFRALTGTKGDDEAVIAYAGEHRVTLVRKGRIDLVTNGKATRRCHCGHPTMTVGGTGDVLAGAIGAMLARGADPFQAACAGTYLVGRAGEVAGAVLGPGAQATDVHEAIPTVLMRLPACRNDP